MRRTNVHTIIYIGVGCGEELFDIPSEAVQVVLIEPQPEFAELLRHKVLGKRNVTVVEAAVMSGVNEGKLNIFNFADTSSLYEPTGILERYPGLKVVDKISINVLS